LSFGGPDKRFRMIVVIVDIGLDRSDQIGDRLKHAAANLFVGQITEPTLDQVEP